MTRVHRKADFGSAMLEEITRLEKQYGVKLGLMHKVLLAETGTVEQLLSILTGAKISVKVLRQEKNKGIVFRESVISSGTGKVLIQAHSKIFTRNIPARVARLIDAQRQGIGTILQDCRMETFRRITEIGYDTEARHVFRKYQILFKKRIAFEITETFLLQ